MAENPVQEAEATKQYIKVVIIGLLLLVIGAVMMTVSVGLGNFIIENLNFSTSVDYVSKVTSVVGNALVITGSAIVVIVAIFLLRQLMRATEIFG